MIRPTHRTHRIVDMVSPIHHWCLVGHCHCTGPAPHLSRLRHQQGAAGHLRLDVRKGGGHWDRGVEFGNGMGTLRNAKELN